MSGRMGGGAPGSGFATALRPTRTILLACSALAAGACAVASRPAPPRDAAVYLAALSDRGFANGSGTTIVADHTLPIRGNAPLVQNLPEDLRDAFVAANATSRPLPVEAVPAGRIRFVAADSVRDLPRGGPGGYWRAFRERFPAARGWAEVSAIGYSPDEARAAVYIRDSCGGRCGGGWLVLLRRDGAAWRVEESRMLWVS